jgi:hypothetical protein
MFAVVRDSARSNFERKANRTAARDYAARGDADG